MLAVISWSILAVVFLAAWPLCALSERKAWRRKTVALPIDDYALPEGPAK